MIVEVRTLISLRGEGYCVWVFLGNALFPANVDYLKDAQSILGQFVITTPPTNVPGVKTKFRTLPPQAFPDTLSYLASCAQVRTLGYIGFSRGAMWGHIVMSSMEEALSARIAFMVLLGGYAPTGNSMRSMLGLELMFLI